MQYAQNSETFNTVDENCEERTLNVHGQRGAFKIEPEQLVEIFYNQSAKYDVDQLVITVE